MNRVSRQMATALVGLLCATTVAAQQDNSFYDDRERGWYFYERDPEPAEKKKPEPPKPEPKKAKKDKTEPKDEPKRAPVTASKDADKQKPEPFSAVWLNKNMKKFKQRAIDNPTEDNVAAYMMLQRLAMDKASRFAQVTQQVRLKYPRLDATNRRPGATYAKRSVDAQSNRVAKQVTNEVLSQAGLWFFYTGRECTTCQKQARVLKSLKQQHANTTLWPITLDGYPMRTSGGKPVFRERRVDAGQAKQLGVTEGPAVYLVAPDGSLQPISHGPIALPQLEKRIRLAGVEAGIISRKRYQETRHVDPRLDLVGPGRTGPQLADNARGSDGEISSRAIIEALSSQPRSGARR